MDPISPRTSRAEVDRNFERLLTYLKRFDALAVAFSGGVDSSFLLAAAKKAISGPVLAITVSSFLVPDSEIQAARKMASAIDAVHLHIDLGEISDPVFLANPVDRCYICKKIIFSQIISAAGKQGVSHVADGSNMDDKKDYRPGMKAVAELGVISPLAETGWTKAQIRAQSHALGLNTWDKPASPCLATRIPYGTPITPKALVRIERAEAVLGRNGFKQCRVRYFGDTAKIEVSENEIVRIVSHGMREHIIARLRKIGFLYVTLDMEGYGSGRLNRAVSDVRQ